MDMTNSAEPAQAQKQPSRAFKYGQPIGTKKPLVIVAVIVIIGAVALSVFRMIYEQVAPVEVPAPAGWESAASVDGAWLGAAPYARSRIAGQATLEANNEDASGGTWIAYALKDGSRLVTVTTAYDPRGMGAYQDDLAACQSDKCRDHVRVVETSLGDGLLREIDGAWQLHVAPDEKTLVTVGAVGQDMPSPKQVLAELELRG